MNITRIVKKLFSAKWKKILPMIKKMKQDSGRSSIDLLADMVRCNIERGFTWRNYATYAFHMHQDQAYRDTYLSQGEMTKIMVLRDSRESMDILNDKGASERYLKPFINRKFVDLRVDSYEDFVALAKSTHKIFTKPVTDSGGNGIQSYEITEDLDLKTLYDHLQEVGNYVVEEAIIQHPEMNKLSLNSVNTIRICTCINDKGEVTVPYQTVRVSLTDSDLDNACLGGAIVSLDDDGVMLGPVLKLLPYIEEIPENPNTGFKYEGFKVPNLQMAKDHVIAAAKSIPGARIIGWDVAVTTTGVDIVESNCNAGPDAAQPYPSMVNGLGVRRQVLEALDLQDFSYKDK